MPDAGKFVPCCSETYEYYTLPFCQPSDITYKSLSHVGEVIDSNRDASTLYSLPFRMDKASATLCTKQLSAAEVNQFRKVCHSCYTS